MCWAWITRTIPAYRRSWRPISAISISCSPDDIAGARVALRVTWGQHRFGDPAIQPVGSGGCAGDGRFATIVNSSTVRGDRMFHPARAAHSGDIQLSDDQRCDQPADRRAGDAGQYTRRWVAKLHHQRDTDRRVRGDECQLYDVMLQRRDGARARSG